MAKHLWSIVCRQAVVDRFSNTLSVFEVIEDVDIKIFADNQNRKKSPVLAAVDFFVVSLWMREELDEEHKEEGLQRTRCLDPNGKIVAQIEQPFEFKDKMVRVRNIFNAKGMPIASSGRYTVQIQNLVGVKRWKTVAEIPIRVTLEVLEADKKSPSLSKH